MLNKIIEKLKNLAPLSIFLYGSRANGNTNSKSDYEIGIIFEEENYVKRDKIKQLVPEKEYSIFPFKKDELLNYTIDTPFQKNLYIASLILGNAHTLYGENIIENLPVPKIDIYDLLMDTSFNLGCALASVRVMKSGNIDLANELMYKSIFYATRNLIYQKTKKLIIGYNNIFNEVKNLDIPTEYKELINISYNLRNETIKNIDESIYFKNISYINKYAIPFLKNNLNVQK